MTLNKMIRVEHIRRSKEWKPEKSPSYYAMVDYFKSLGYNDATAEIRAADFMKG